MSVFDFNFETDEGLAMGQIEARGPYAAGKALAKKFPDDVGSDGSLNDEDGNEFPMMWGE